MADEGTRAARGSDDEGLVGIPISNLLSRPSRYVGCVGCGAPMVEDGCSNILCYNYKPWTSLWWSRLLFWLRGLW